MIEYLTQQNIIDINEFQIKRYSPKEPIGITQQSALEMIVALPKQEVFGMELYSTVLEKAVIVYQKLVKKHVFYNGNKRTAYHTLAQFLRMSGYKLTMSTDKAIELTVRVATDNMTDNEIIIEIQEYVYEI